MSHSRILCCPGAISLNVTRLNTNLDSLYNYMCRNNRTSPGEAEDTVNDNGKEVTDATVGDNGNIKHMQEAIGTALADKEK